jgi:hypothetical protein
MPRRTLPQLLHGPLAQRPLCLTRFGPWQRHTPESPAPADWKVVTIPMPLGKEKAEHTFKFRKK